MGALAVRAAAVAAADGAPEVGAGEWAGAAGEEEEEEEAAGVVVAAAAGAVAMRSASAGRSTEELQAAKLLWYLPTNFKKCRLVGARRASAAFTALHVESSHNRLVVTNQLGIVVASREYTPWPRELHLPNRQDAPQRRRIGPDHFLQQGSHRAAESSVTGQSHLLRHSARPIH